MTVACVNLNVLKKPSHQKTWMTMDVGKPSTKSMPTYGPTLPKKKNPCLTMPNIQVKTTNLTNILMQVTMSDWLEYTVPKIFVPIYVRHVFTNFAVLIFFALLFFGQLPGALSFLIIFLMSDFSFYAAIMKN